MADPRRSIEILDQLEAMGFTNEAYQLLHHSRARGWKHTISRHRAYCEKVSSFQHDGDAERDQRRFEFVLEKYLAGGYPAGRSEIFEALANRAFEDPSIQGRHVGSDANLPLIIIAAEQSLAADGAIACFSSNLIPSARMLIARRS